jgi:hypothetical protein
MEKQFLIEKHMKYFGNGISVLEKNHKTRNKKQEQPLQDVNA